MKKVLLESEDLSQDPNLPPSPMPRRNFLRYSAAGVALTGVALAGCNDKRLDMLFDTPGSNQPGYVNVGSGDFGVLNYAYALEQLEAAFYAEVLKSPYLNSASESERKAFIDIADHELAHRYFLRKAIEANGGKPIRDLRPDFSSVNFSSRSSVLATARAFEDLGVAAYNGAGKLISNPTFLLLAGKIVSVEARHAAVIRDFIQNGTFVGPDVVEQNTGLERSKTPNAVVAIANTFLTPNSKLNVDNLPKE